MIVPPVADQVTAWFVWLETVAVNCWDWFVPIEAVNGVIWTFVLTTLTVAFALDVGLATLVAVTVHVAAAFGAVKRPVELIFPSVVDQVTAVFVLPETVAENWI